MKKLIFIISFLSVISLSAQNTVQKQLISNGATQATDLEFKLHASVGQSFTSLQTNNEFQIAEGFWQAIADNSVSVIETTKDPVSTFDLKKIYPNPAKDVCYIELENDQVDQFSITLYNIQGKLLTVLYNNTLSKGIHTIKINTTQFPSGQYLLSFNKSNQIKSSLLVVE